ncbi:MAG: hypothetical protein NTW89_00825 [Burkholderiales bacterium]|nr:hypothetical protein [Burkholderiales bacterium]
MSLAPVLGALLVYFNPSLRPEGTASYGTLIDPQRPIPSVSALPATNAACPESCARKLFILRNSHASQGKHVERLMRIWFITDDAPVPEKVLEAYKGAVMVRIKPDVLKQFLLPQVSDAEAREALAKPLWVIDPRGNLILQYPPEADPERFRNQIRKLIANSRIG